MGASNVDAWIEQSYAHSNLGSLALRRGDVTTAAAAFRISIELKLRARASKPQDPTLADSLSWLASAQEAGGDLPEALLLYEREQRLLETLNQTAPDGALWRHRLALALQHGGQGAFSQRGTDLVSIG